MLMNTHRVAVNRLVECIQVQEHEWEKGREMACHMEALSAC